VAAKIAAENTAAETDAGQVAASAAPAAPAARES
jgi:hypothetical protein